MQEVSGRQFMFSCGRDGSWLIVRVFVARDIVPCKWIIRLNLFFNILTLTILGIAKQ